MAVELREVKSEEQALSMRRIRNECAAYMTVNKKKITIEQQMLWFETVYEPQRAKGNIFAYLAFSDLGLASGEYLVGYSILRHTDNKWWLTAGLQQIDRHKGLGKEIFTQLGDKVKDLGSDEAWLDVLIDNKIAHHLYELLGYREVSRTDKVITMNKRLL